VERADVLIVGGGPAGSACATSLVAAGADVLVVDKARFPRDKPCAGWITPEIVDHIPFSIAAYGRDHVAQPISRFRVGRIGGSGVDVEYGRPVSYGIRRVEFDAALLRASGARVLEGALVKRIERREGVWILNESLAAPVLVGAGGHFCPVARHLGGAADEASVVVAREIELPLDGTAAAACRVEEDRPELYFCADFRGYGWCFRKESYLNVGLGRLDSRHLSSHLKAFVDSLIRAGRIARLPDGGWRGHAYRIHQGPRRPIAGDEVVLAGDAAGLAAPASGEGILAARISGELAAEAILSARIEDYEARLEARLGRRAAARRLPDRIAGVLGAALLALPGVTRRLVVDRWFLHRSGRQESSTPQYR
jgi:geranylgeranyl reductase family protein